MGILSPTSPISLPVLTMQNHHRRPSGRLISTTISLRQARPIHPLRWSVSALKRISLVVGILISFILGLKLRHTVLTEKRPQAGYAGMLKDEKYLRIEPERAQSSELLPQGLSQADLSALANTTLGFERVFVVSWPGSKLKLKAFDRAANVTGFDYKVLDGTAEEGNEEQAAVEQLLRAARRSRTAKEREEKEKAAAVAAKTVWYQHSHLNVAKRIITEDIGSALIVEDNADWDVGLREQLKTFALGSNLLLGPEPQREKGKKNKKEPSTPYGHGWDMLWLGHCGNLPVPRDQRRFTIRNDPTVPPGKHRNAPGSVPDWLKKHDHDDESTRIVYRAGEGACLYAYALSLKGASKMLYHYEATSANIPVDVALSRLCEFPAFDFKCVGVFPQLMDGLYIGKGETGYGVGNDQGMGKVDSWNIEYSTRQNINNLRQGRKAINRWPDGKALPMDIDISTKFLSEGDTPQKGIGSQDMTSP